MELSGKQVIMITEVDDGWVWKHVSAGDHGVVREGDGKCATRADAVAEAAGRHPGLEVIEADSPNAAY